MEYVCKISEPNSPKRREESPKRAMEEFSLLHQTELFFGRFSGVSTEIELSTNVLWGTTELANLECYSSLRHYVPASGS